MSKKKNHKLGQIFIGAVEVSIYETTEEQLPDAWGKFHNGEIHLVEKMPPGEFTTTLFHEISHATVRLPTCQVDTCFGMDLIQEERACEAIGLVLAQNFDEITRLIQEHRAKSNESE